MRAPFPVAIPEIPVSNIEIAVAYYVGKFGFHLDWGDEAGGIAGISQAACRLFLTNGSFRSQDPGARTAPAFVHNCREYF